MSRNAHFQNGSVVGLHVLDEVTVEQLLYWLLVFSGNDAAVALAEKTSGSVDKFVAKMNDKAKAMGLTNTHFTNPNGLEPDGPLLLVHRSCGHGPRSHEERDLPQDGEDTDLRTTSSGRLHSRRAQEQQRSCSPSTSG